MPPDAPDSLRDDALAIWKAGVQAVDSCRLVEGVVSISDDGGLSIGQRQFPTDSWERLIVVGAGKAGAGMAAGVLAALGKHAATLQEAGRLEGWVNVPEDCVDELPAIHLHGARPAGHNQPTAAGVHGAREILQRVRAAGPRDICLCLISGGGSALLPLPIDGVALDDIQRLTGFLSAAGANIAELNTVRKQLSQVKGGRLAAACNAGHLATLIISDVIGDPLDVIASGPTIPDTSTPAEALAILERFSARDSGASSDVWDVLQRRQQESPAAAPTIRSETFELVIGNNAVAVEAAADEAQRRGYNVQAEPARELEGDASDLGERLARRAIEMREGRTNYQCLISGGEPTVTLAPESVRGKGGRNQQLVAAALVALCEAAGDSATGPCDNLALLSGGTDGEDGPTNAAGAWIAESLPTCDVAAVRDAIARSDTFTLFEQLGNLIQCGPTHTNVCDVRVALAARPA